jgi:hypothetical protein
MFVGAGLDFPPRNETYSFRTELESKYQHGLRRSPGNSYADVEGSVVWTQEYLLYRLHSCSHDGAINKVKIQIQGGGLPAVCGAVPPGVVSFPPRDQTFLFRQSLEEIYRSDLKRSPSSTHVDMEGDIVWVQEYLRYRLNRCSHQEATDRVMQQIDGRAIPPVCR